MKKLLLFLTAAVALLNLTPASAWTKGTCVNGRISSASSGNISVTASTGNLLVFMVEKAGSGSNSMTSGYPQDTNGTLSTAVAYSEVLNNTVYTAIGTYYELAAASGTHTFSVAFASSGNFVLFGCAYAYTGTAALDAAAANAQGSGTSAATNSLTPSQSGDLIISPVISSLTSANFNSWLNSFTQEDSNNAGNPSGTWGDLNPDGGTTSVSTGATISSSGGGWAAGLVAFKLTTSATCANYAKGASGVFAVPNGTSGSYMLADGSIGTPDCSTKRYPNKVGGIAVN